VILRISHGYQVKDDHDPFLELAENALRIFAKCTTQGAFLVDAFPSRRSRLHGTLANTKRCIVQYVPEWFPGVGFRTAARKWKAEILEMVNQPHQWVKEQVVGYFMTCLNGWSVEIQ